MAEVLGTAASILQVAEIGFSLATTLYKYAASVKGAEKDIKKIARDVKLTSKVLERTHEQIKVDYEAQLCTEEALIDLEDVLEGCRDAFEEVDNALKGSMKIDAKGESKIPMSERLKWPLKQNKLDVLRANLEKLKTTLLLMLSVLAYGTKIQQQQAARMDVKVELALEKLQIQNLVQAKDEATQRFEELSAAFAKLEASVNSKTSQNLDTANAPQANVFVSTAVSNIEQPPMSTGTSHDRQGVMASLSLCASAVSKLTGTIELATKKWQADQVLEHSLIFMRFYEAAGVISTLGEHARVQSLRSEEHKAAQTGIASNPVVGTPAAPASVDSHIHPASKRNLEDYQMELMLQEHNKRRLLMARLDSSGSGATWPAPGAPTTVLPRNQDSSDFTTDFSQAETYNLATSAAAPQQFVWSGSKDTWASEQLSSAGNGINMDSLAPASDPAIDELDVLDQFDFDSFLSEASERAPRSEQYSAPLSSKMGDTGTFSFDNDDPHDVSEDEEDLEEAGGEEEEESDDDDGNREDTLRKLLQRWTKVTQGS